MNTLERAARKEKKEHPWASMSVARKIAKDHLMKRRRNPQTAYNVYLGNKHIDTVFYTGYESVAEVKRSLVNHDGYDPSIRVTKSKKWSRKNPCRSNSNVPLRKKKATTVSAGATVNVVRLYSTDVVTHDLSTGKITLRTGGWTTTTTVRRMNQYAEQFGVPYHVHIKNRQAYVTVQRKSYCFDNEIIIQL